MLGYFLNPNARFSPLGHFIGLFLERFSLASGMGMENLEWSWSGVITERFEWVAKTSVSPLRSRESFQTGEPSFGTNFIYREEIYELTGQVLPEM